MKIVFLDASTVGDVPNMDEIRRLGDYAEYDVTPLEKRVERIGDAEVVIVNKTRIDRDVLSACPNLKLVCVAATGMNNIDLECAAELGVPVKNVAGYSTGSVAQVTFAMVLELLVRTSLYNRYVQSGEYCDSPIFTNHAAPFWEIGGKCWGIIGLGAIGKRVASIARAFGANVRYYSTSGKNLESEYEHLELNELLQTSDIVSIHAPLNERTSNLLDLPRLRMMKKTALLVNAGRGGIVNEQALAEAIDSEAIAGAGIDVYEREPMEPNHPYLKVKNKDRLLLLPHIAWASVESRTLLVSKIAENIKSLSA